MPVEIDVEHVARLARLSLSPEEVLEAARLAGLEEELKEMPMGLHTMLSDGGELPLPNHTPVYSAYHTLHVWPVQHG